MLAALTVAIVALPLSMAIAVASGVSPERGLYAAVIGGFLVSALGGSRYQIGGPAGAFIVLVAATATKFGLEGLLLTVFLSGFMLTADRPAAAWFAHSLHSACRDRRLHLRDCGHDLCQPAQGSRRPEIARCRTRTAIAQARDARSGVADPQPGRARYRRGLGRLDLPAAALAAELAGNADRRRACLAGRHGCSICRSRPSAAILANSRMDCRRPDCHRFSTSSVLDVLPAALSFTLLGAVESLLSAKVADGMTGRKHRYNMEVVAQGIANVASAMFGGISVTGTIARTATNIRAGACSPVSGMAHAVCSCWSSCWSQHRWQASSRSSTLAGVLVVVCWNMAEKEEFLRLLHDWRGASVLIATFGLTLIEDLTFGIIAGCVLAAAFAVFDRVTQQAKG